MQAERDVCVRDAHGVSDKCRDINPDNDHAAKREGSAMLLKEEDFCDVNVFGRTAINAGERISEKGTRKL